MSLHKLTATLLGALTTAAASLGATAPAQAQIYGYSNGWRQPIQSGPVMRLSQSGGLYRQSYPVMQQPNFGQPQRISNPGDFGHSSGSYFGR